MKISTHLIFHFIAELAQKRAEVARIIFALGHHTEVYSDADELVDHRPTRGIVLIHEVGDLRAEVVRQTLSNHGIWLPVIGMDVNADAGLIVAIMKSATTDSLVGPYSAGTMLAKLEECAKEAKAVSETLSRQARARSILARLSEREHQLLDHLATGMSKKGMARALGASLRTLEVYRMKMMAKMEVQSSKQAVKIWIDALDR